MSRIDYSIKGKGTKIVSANEVWVKGKKGFIRNRKYSYLGKIDMSMPNMIVSAVQQDKKPVFVADTSDLTSTQKKQIVDYFYTSKGKRNHKSVAYIVRNKKK